MDRGTLKVFAVALFTLGSADWVALNLVVGPAAFAAPQVPAPSISPVSPAAESPPSGSAFAQPSTAPPASATPLPPVASLATPPVSASASPAEPPGAFAQIQFAAGSTLVGQDAVPTLRAVAKMMREDTKLRPRFEGHADDPGNKASNDFLALQRARLARSFVGSTGVDPGRIDVAGFGNGRKLDNAGTPEAAARNRRVEIHLK
jgi:outer membrane protein OmpA-like peptidoglycan-associated protein